MDCCKERRKKRFLFSYFSISINFLLREKGGGGCRVFAKRHFYRSILIVIEVVVEEHRKFYVFVFGDSMLGVGRRTHNDTAFE